MKYVKADNKGYSLVELIIVLAIIAIVSTMSIITVNLIYSSNVKADASDFNAEIAELKGKVNMYPSSATEKYEMLYYAKRLYKYDGAFYLQDCIYSPTTDTFYYKTPGGSDTVNISYKEFGGYDASGNEIWTDKTKAVDISKVETDNNGLGMKMSAYCTVRFKAVGATDFADIPADGQFIVYNRDGVINASYKSGTLTYNGAGEYDFLKNSGAVVSSAYVRVNGSHEVY